MHIQQQLHVVQSGVGYTVHQRHDVRGHLPRWYLFERNGLRRV